MSNTSGMMSRAIFEWKHEALDSPGQETCDQCLRLVKDLEDGLISTIGTVEETCVCAT
jgi:hypothetical protein